MNMRETSSLCILAVILTLLPCATARAATRSEEVAELALKSSDSAARGGLALWINPSDSKGLAKLAAGSGLYVQGAAGERERAERLRAELKGAAEADRVSVVWRRTAHLPYLDNLVGMLVAEGWGEGELKDLPLSEVMRVVHPWGVAVIGSDSGADAAALLAEAGKLKLVRAEKLDRKGAWVKIAKLPDPALGEWCGEASQGISVVSGDQAVAPSREVRWVNTPLWGAPWEGYGKTGSYGGEIFAGGRSFHTEVDWISPKESQYSVVARDAFNGVVLWREKIAHGSCVVGADETRVYLYEGKDSVARDALTGKVINNYGALRGRYFHHVGDKLVVSVYCPLSVVDRASGKTLWSRPSYPHTFPPAAKGDLLFLAGPTVEAVNIADGKTAWKASPKEFAVAGAEFASIVCKGDALYVTAHLTENGNKVTRLVAMDAAGGAVRWSDTRPRSNAMVMPFDDQVWYARTTKPKDPKREGEDYEFTALDAKTGKELKTICTPKGGGCWGVRATDRYLVWSRSSFLDRHTFELSEQFGVRSACGQGQIPAYGLLYYGTHTCNCYVALRGIYALSGGSGIPKGEVAPQLVKGPGSAAAGAPAGASDWPLYRASLGRGNSLAAELPAELKTLWSAKLAATGMPQATGAGALVFASVSEQHRVVALDLATGAEKWSFPTEGRVAMAPTYHKGLCLVGDHAGWVYCLEAATGRLVWQFQAAPEQKYMSAYGQFESSWPVKSGVLVLDDVAYFVAGRCGTMDGGVHLYGIDPATGAVLMKKNFFDNQKWERAPKTADLLLSDGQSLIGWGGRLETAKPASKTPAGGAAAAQPTLRFGTTWQGPNGILDMLATMNPAGTYMKSTPSDGRAGGETICFDKDRTITGWRELDGRKIKEDGFGRCRVTCTQGDKKGVVAWTNQNTRLQMRALLLAGGRVYCAGIPEFQEPEEKPALVVLSAADGKELQRIPLEAAPAIDGLSAVGGRLILTTVNGQVLCFGTK